MKDNNVARRLRRGNRGDRPLSLFFMLLAALTTAAILSLGSADPLLAQPNTCGNGTLDSGEDCDLSSPLGAFCPMGQVCTSSCDCVFVATTTLPTTLPPTTSLPVATTTTTTVVAPTTTTTLPGGLDHFQCYEAKRMAVTAGPVTVQDQFGTATGVQLSKPNRLCAHLFEVARSLGVPAIVGVDLEPWRGDDALVAVDGDEGVVSLLCDGGRS